MKRHPADDNKQMKKQRADVRHVNAALQVGDRVRLARAPRINITAQEVERGLVVGVTGEVVGVSPFDEYLAPWYSIQFDIGIWKGWFADDELTKIGNQTLPDVLPVTLINASAIGDVAGVDQLLQQGADVREQDNFALRIASENGQKQ